MPVPRAVILDFNGTLSDDEPLLLQLLTDAFTAEGIELDPGHYDEHLLGLSDPEIVTRVLEHAGVEADAATRDRVLQAKIDAYREEIRREPRITPDAVEFVRALAAELPLAVASGAFAEEIELALELAGIRRHFVAVVAIEEVDRGKPDPEGYDLALARINQHRSLSRSIVAANVLAVEDSVAGVTAAQAAGLRCAAVAGDERVERAADFVIDRLDADAARRILGR